MYKNGFLQVSLITNKLEVGNISFNQNEILKEINNNGAGIILFPELSITGYTAKDLFYQTSFLKDALKALKHITENNNSKALIVVGLPLEYEGVLYNVGAVIKNNKVIGIIPKRYLPNHLEFSEKRWFKTGYDLQFEKVNLFGYDIPFGNLLFVDRDKDIKIGVEVCQDLWANYAPSDDLANAGANIILNLSASTEYIGKKQIRKNVVMDHSRKQMTAYLYTTTGSFESVGEAVFASHKIIASQGVLLKEDDNFYAETSRLDYELNINKLNYQRRVDSNYSDHLKSKEDYKEVLISFDEKDFEFKNEINQTPFVNNLDDIEEAFNLQVEALKNKMLRLPKNLRKIVLGVSGGLDSTLALIVAYEAFIKAGLNPNNIIGVILPSSNTSSKTLKQAHDLIDLLGVRKIEINIEDEVKLHLKSIEHDKEDVTYENVQARVRTMILMNLANKYEGIVLGTGNLSEIALGFMTYNADQMSMYAINSGIPKTMIYYLLDYYGMINFKVSKVLKDVCETPISPELKKDQKTEDVLGLYLINDFIMYHHLVSGMDENELIWYVDKAFDLDKGEAEKYVKRFFKLFYQNQFKRQVMPEGPKILSFSLSPRGDFVLASDVVRNNK